MAELAIFRLERRIGELRRQLAERDDGRLGQSLQGELSTISSAIVDMEEFAKVADKKRERNSQVGEWVKMVMDAAHRGEDLVDGYLVRAKLAESRDFSTAGTIAPRFTTTITRGRRLIARRFLKRRLPAFSQEMERLLSEIQHLVSALREETDIQQVKGANTPRGEADRRFGAAPVFTDFPVVGMEQDVEKMKRWLLERNAGSGPVTIFVTGMGVGKTTLAAMVYNATRNYFYCCAWANISRRFNTRSVLEAILEQLYADIAPAQLSRFGDRELRVRISSYLEGTNYLGGVWLEDNSPRT